MLFEKYIPHPLLQPYIREYMVIACAAVSVNSILPATGLTLVFRYQGRVAEVTDGAAQELPLSMLSGLRKSPRLIRYAAGSGNVLVLFREAGAAAFFPLPMHELFQTNIPLADCIHPQLTDRIGNQLATAACNRQRVAVIEEFLLSRLQQGIPDQLVAAAVQRIQAVAGVIRIKELAASLYISQDAFEKRFRKTVGTSPKQYCNLVRMKAIVARGNKHQTLTGIAFDAGYADQPHFNKDFRLFTGQSPTEFFNTPPRW